MNSGNPKIPKIWKKYEKLKEFSEIYLQEFFVVDFPGNFRDFQEF
jgi:hypothetical protein